MRLFHTKHVATLIAESETGHGMKRELDALNLAVVPAKGLVPGLVWYKPLVMVNCALLYGKDCGLLGLLSNESEYIRGWAVQILAEGNSISSKTMEQFTRLAKSDPSAMVRVYLISAAQRIDKTQAWALLELLYQHAEDKDDHNIPLMLWYALEPFVKDQPQKALELASKTPITQTLKYTVQRIADMNTPESKKLLESFLPTLDHAGGEQQHEIMGIISKLIGK